MVKLKTLIQNIVESYQIIVIDSYDENRTVNRVDFLSRSMLADPNTLYLCADDSLLYDRKVRHLAESQTQPLLILSTIQNMDSPLPIIKLSRMPDPMNLFIYVNDCLKFESQIQEETNELYHMLYAGQGLNDIVSLMEQFLKCPVSVLDASYSLVALSPLMEQMTYGLDRSGNHIFLSLKEIESLRRLQIEHQIYQHNRAFCIDTEDHPDNNWIFCAIRIQHVMSGYVAVALPANTQATERQLRLTSIFADICSIEMQKQELMVQRTGMQYETFLIELIEGKYTDINMIESRLKILNHQFGKFFCLVVLHCTVPHNSDLFNKQQMAALRKIYTNSMSVVYRNDIVLLINQEKPVTLNEDFTDPLYNFGLHNQLKVILSQPFADILKIPIFYRQAIGTLELYNFSDSEQILYYSTEALPEYLFSKCEYKELETGIHYHIFQLKDYDAEYHTDFIGTLRCYLANNRNATQTAEALHVHRSTFFYRAKKIEELLGISLNDSNLLFLYELSFKIWDYLSK